MITSFAKDYKLGFPHAKGVLTDIQYPCYVDQKVDGELNFAIIKEGFMVNKPKYGRHRADFPAMKELLSVGFADDVVVCGELYFGTSVYDILRNKESDELKFAIFDYFTYSDKYTSNCKLDYATRRTNLEAMFAGKTFDHIHLTDCKQVKDAPELIARKKQLINAGWEGVIAKQPKSLWMDGDTKQWAKLKKVDTSDLVVLGYSRKAKYLSLLLGYELNGKYVPICGCASGLSLEQKDEYAKLLVADRLPDAEQFNKEYHLVTPKYLVEVSYQEKVITDGRISLRHPVFLRWRDDKTLAEISL